MRMHLLSGGRLRMRRSVYYPDAGRDETFELPVVSVLLKHPRGNVLFDTGCHPDAAVNAEARWGALTKFITPIFRPDEAVVGQLPLAGLTAADIDVVVCSHFHMDHCGCNSFFPRATVVCHAKELEIGRSDAPDNPYMRIDWDHGGVFETIEAERDLFGDGRITLLPMPGHTPGMTTAHVVLDRDGAFLLVSDAVAVRENLDRRHSPRVNWDAELTLLAYEEIARLEEDGATVILGHDDAQWRRMRTGAGFYE